MPTARLPVEITVAGSSGVGPIPPGTDRLKTEVILKSVLPHIKSFRMRFQEIRRFPNTNTFFLTPEDRQPFDNIHGILKASGITFDPIPWPYNPHCTLRAGPMTGEDSLEKILGLSFPKGAFLMDTLSIYEFESTTLVSHLSFQTKF